MLSLILVCLVLLALIYLCYIRPYQYWIKRGVTQGSPVPIFGDNWRIVLRWSTLFEHIENVYNTAPDARYLGTYNFLSPTILLRDPDLIKQITVKDFDNFTDHFNFLSEDIDPLWSKNLFSLRGQRWREMRSTLSPSFTSSKMRYMFDLMLQNGKQFVNYFVNKDEDVITIEAKDTFVRFTNDVVANVAFGVECDSLKDPNNEFYLMGQDITNFQGFWKVFGMFTQMIFPKIAKMMGYKFFSEKVRNFFIDLVKDNIASREKHGIVRPDLINLLMEARKSGLQYEETNEDKSFAVVQESDIGKSSRGQKIQLTDEDITAQALLFFFAGYDTVSTLMMFVAYELAINPDIQRKLTLEIDNAFKDTYGKITYEKILSMKYLDMVVSETLRLWPTTVPLDRVCLKPYTIQPSLPNEVPITLEKGIPTWIAVYSIHRDPKYYEEPNRFDPERFSEENKSKIKPFTYLPFGSGPRACIGSRFGLLETKILFFYLLSNFEIVPVEKTEIPIQISKASFISTTAKNGLWLGLKRRRCVK